MGEAFLGITSEFVTWPSQNQAQSVVADFEAKSGFPGILVVIDGSHIPICCPKADGKPCHNKKQFYSVILQGVCDSNLVFVHCSAGEPGSAHDASVLRKSDVFTHFNPSTFSFESRLIGDAPYPVGPHL